MQITYFILLIFAVGLMRAIPRTLQYEGKKQGDVNYLWVALILALGFNFITPLVLNWFLDFLFGFTLDYWIAFAFLFVLNIFTTSFEKHD